MQIIRLFFSFLLIWLMCGCVHNVTLMERNNGAMWTGQVARALVSYSGDISINFKGEQFTGKWVFASNSTTSMGLLNTYGKAGGVSSSIGTGLIVGGLGIGNAFLHSESNKTLRCEFQYSEMSDTGIGICQDNEGGIYDMQID